MAGGGRAGKKIYTLPSTFVLTENSICLDVTSKKRSKRSKPTGREANLFTEVGTTRRSKLPFVI